MKLLVGLGNPGKKYKKTRHNVGFMFVDQIANDFGVKFTKNKSLNCEIAFIKYDLENIIIIKPQTYMNLSGNAVSAVANYYQIEIEEIIVVYDDIELPAGTIRIRQGGSSGGHKGMKNIIETIKTKEVKRIRIGIDKEDHTNTCDYVLSSFSKEEKTTINFVISKAREILEYYLSESFENFMGRYNGVIK